MTETTTKPEAAVHEIRRAALLDHMQRAGCGLWYASMADQDLWIVAGTQHQASDALRRHLCDSMTRLDRAAVWDAMREELAESADAKGDE